MPRIAIIIGSTRDTRFADKPANWIYDLARKRNDIKVELVDVRDYDLPFFNEMASNLWVPSQNPNALKWQQTIGEFDGYIFVTAEYNRSIPASLKNALDQAYVEWNRKPAAYVGYGSVGGARAVEHLRTISVELQMVPVRAAVHIGGSEFMKVSPLGANGPMSDIEEAMLPGANDMLDQLTWWAGITKRGREEEVHEAAE
jgi:NAD(P)H-dependent FMN reductase